MITHQKDARYNLFESNEDYNSHQSDCWAKMLLHLHIYTGFTGNNHSCRHVQKQPVLHHSLQQRYLLPAAGVLNLSLEMQLYNVV
ncbi:hypothetical protein EUGRSUZ_B02421 [Eucalyptus grandis]|uniref:Uncharacterized protein n=2 Tax=Eucalyptus grandis TaxID=71139 RepID=A0ACC3LTH9_EUCGR|nr:hypothetical protein EUGRSUZ_B02421 [Eucalyptus grandis]